MRYLYTLLVIISTNLAFSQSYSGNLNSEFTETTLSYGNVDIYKGDSLVASVLTDKDGNFKVPLDKGEYRVEVNYVGHKPIVKTINVEADEVEKLTLKDDPKATKKIKTVAISEEAEAYDMDSRSFKVDGYAFSTPATMSMDAGDGSGAVYRSVSAPSFSAPGKGGFTTGSGRAGALTAGEVNDFSKWDMWQDIAAGELKMYQESWKMNMVGRFSVIVKNKIGLPISDAIVRLFDAANKQLFQARTDNTGRAELWADTRGDFTKDRKYSIKVEYLGIEETIKRATTFEDGINYQVLDVTCDEKVNVDIAFVVDATGSMGDELHYLQAEMNDVIFQSKSISNKLNFHFANVFYRDRGDAYVTKSQDFTRVLSEAKVFIDEQSAGGGGDYEEAVEEGLDEAINKLSWNDHARARVLFLILDAPPHIDEARLNKLQQLIHEAAEKGIRIVPVGASGINKATEYLMRSIALGTNGTYTFLTNHSGIGNNHIEPSTDSYKVETFNDVMVRILKSYTYMPDCEQNIPELNLDYPDSTVTINQPLDSLAISDSTLTSDSTNVIPRDSVSHIDFQPQISWKYYPNPTTGIVNVQADVDIDELFITDLSGKLLQSINDMKEDRIYQVDLSQYTTGVYLIRYLHEEHWITGKIMLIH